ncbi:MAG: DUF4352 domain-containing protein [Mycobacterium leprae]
MKRTVTITLALLLLVLTAGCGKNAADPKASPAAASGQSGTGSTVGSNATGATGSTGTAAATPAAGNQKKTYQPVTLGPLKVGEAAQVGPLKVTPTETAWITKGAPQGYAYILVNMSIADADSDDYTINVTDHFNMAMPDTKKAPYNMQATGQKSPRLQGAVSKGQTVTGWMGFLTKATKGKYTFTFKHPDYGTATWEFDIN